MALGISGSYEGYNFSVGGSTGAVAAQASPGEIFQFRWTSSAKRCRILCVQASAAAVSAFAAGAAVFDMVIARSWSVDGTGGATLTPSQLRAKQNPSLAGTVRIATTVALGAGTKTFDASAINTLVGGVPATAGTPIIYPIPLYVDWAAYGIPLVLDTNEGFSVRATTPATGTFQAGIWVAWAEID